MFRIDTSGAVATPPATLPVGTPGYFGNGTVVDFDWFNAVQTEIENVITGAGLTLNKNLRNQLFTAIGSLISNSFARASNTSSWVFIGPMGLILQGCQTPKVSLNGTQVMSYPFTFPKAFTTTCTVVGSDTGNAGITWGSFSVNAARSGGTGYVWGLAGATGLAAGNIFAAGF